MTKKHLIVLMCGHEIMTLWLSDTKPYYCVSCARRYLRDMSIIAESKELEDVR